MARYYKPNNATVLYLNTSFNCIKSNSITITKTGNGTGYTSAPTVVIRPATGDMGTGAAATIPAPVSGALSGTLVMVNNGRGYNVLPTIDLVGGGEPGRITNLTITNGGSGYTSAPTISATGGGGTGFSAIGVINNGVLVGVSMTSRGSNYSTTPTIAISGGGSPGVITGATITNQGSGYTTAPTVSITGGGGTGATATANISGGKVISLNITNGGSGYTSAPTIAFSGGGGTGAAASAVVNLGTAAAATPVLTLGTSATFTVAFTRTFSYTWNIPDININDLGKLSVITIMGTSVATTPYTFRIMGVQYDSRNSYFSDFGNPIISMTQISNTFTSLGSTGSNAYHIILSPQTLRQIQISVDDSITAKDTGVLVANSNFVIALEIEEYDPVLTRIDDPYSEGASKLKLNY